MCRKQKESQQQRKHKKRYKVRTELFYSIMIALILMLTVSLIWQITNLTKLASKQIAQVMHISYLKNVKIRTNMMADLKQNEFNLIHQDLWGAAKSISDMVSRPEILVPEYQAAGAPGMTFSQYEVFQQYKAGTGQVEFDQEGLNWGRPGWYFKQGSVDLAEYPIIEEAVGVCGLTLPFTTKAGVNAAYSYLTNPGTYIGLADSALMCSRPIPEVGSGAFLEQLDENYYCPKEKLPFEYQDSWGAITFSPICKDWFKNQQENYQHGTIEQRYVPNINQNKIITSCMPILDQVSQDTEPRFYGAMCLDHEPVGDLLGFFPVESDVLPKFVIFATDQYYEQATVELTVLGIDVIRDQRRDRFLVQSRFYTDIEYLAKHEFDQAMEITDIEIESDKGLLFDSNYVTWGSLNLTAKGQEPSLEDAVVYLYVVDELSFDFNRAELYGTQTDSIEQLRSDNKIVSNVKMQFAYFVNGKQKILEVEMLELWMELRIQLTLLLEMFLIYLGFCILSYFVAKERSSKITRGIINLYETLQKIQDQKAINADQKTTVLSFRFQSHELNQLHVTFNNVAKTILLAADSKKKNENKNKALLNYSEAYGIFGDFDDAKHKAICLSNIGAIMLQKKDYSTALASLKFAYEIQHQLMKEDSEAAKNEFDTFILACRLFQKGLANFQILKTEYPHRALFSQEALHHDTYTTRFNYSRTVTEFNGEKLRRDLDSPENIIPDEANLPIMRKKTNSEKPYKSNDISKTELLVDRIGQDFFHALEKFRNIRHNLEDFSILIALYYLDLILIRMFLFKHQAKKSQLFIPPRSKLQEQAIIEDRWKESGLDPDLTLLLDKLNRLRDTKMMHKTMVSERETRASKMRETLTQRMGLQEVDWQQLLQYQSYLKGFYFHAKGDHKEAARWYTHSLETDSQMSTNIWRLQALEGIENIIHHSIEDEKQSIAIQNEESQMKQLPNLMPQLSHRSPQYKSPKRRKSTAQRKLNYKIMPVQSTDQPLSKMISQVETTTPKLLSESQMKTQSQKKEERKRSLRKKRAVYEMLSHHYVQRRSVIFIVDSDFNSVFYQDIAMKQVLSTFEKLDEQDYFGYISLGKNMELDSFVLEKKQRNIQLKTRQLNIFSKNYSFSYEKNATAKHSRLEIALEKALEWQIKLVEDTPVTVNNKTYVGPHKWIVCLIGSDIYMVNDLLTRHQHTIRKRPNLSISMLGLSSKPLKAHVSHYRKLCHTSRQGDYLNLVNRDSAEALSEKFLSAMDVYQSQEIPIIREYFQNI